MSDRQVAPQLDDLSPSAPVAPAPRRVSSPRLDGALASPLAALWFDNRRWYHPAVFVGALVLGGGTRAGAAAAILLVLLYAALRCWAARFIGGAARVHRRKASKPRSLVTDGPFAYVRNPLYVANSLGIAGACALAAPPWYAALAGLGSLLWYVGVTRFEIPTLLALYPDEYPDYLARTPAFVPRLRAVASRSAGPRTTPKPWSRVLARERGALAFAALLVGAGVWRLVAPLG